ncbi:MAG: hypothetical protein WAM28_07520 [Chlamydiales bacterium]
MTTSIYAENSGSVVTVHGFMRSSKSMAVMASSIGKEGWRVLNWSYPSRSKYIEEHAEELVNRLKILSHKYPDRPISFVTHSLGALIVRSTLNHPDCPSEAKKGCAVLIAPPNRGAYFARYLHRYPLFRKILGEKAGQELMTTPRDGFDHLGDFPNQMPILIISGTGGTNPIIPDLNDGKVGLKETCLSTSHYHQTTPSRHTWICYKSDVIKKTKKFLFIYGTGGSQENR